MWGYKNKSYLDKTSVRNGLGTLIVGKDGRDVIQTYYQPSNSYYIKSEINAGDVGTYQLKYGTKNVTIVNNNEVPLYVAKTEQEYIDNNYMIVPPYSSFRITFPINNGITIASQTNDGVTRNFYLEMEV